MTHFTQRPLPVRAGLLLLAGLLAAGGARAALRDPTEPPAAAQAPASSAIGDDTPAPTVPRHIVVSEGRAYVVERGRRFGVGDTLGHARIERIDSDAIWLRDGNGSRRVPLYAGVTKRPAAESPVPAAPPASAAAATRTVRKDLKTPSQTHSQKKETL